MRSSEPTKYPYSDEHYRIEFKDSQLQYPCFVDNIIIHEGFSIYFEWFLNESIEWKWRCLKPEDKKNKKKETTKGKHTAKKPLKTQPKPRSARNKQNRVKEMKQTQRLQ